MPPQNDEERAEPERLITQMREGKRDFEHPENDEVVLAINKLRKRGWLKDTSLYQADLSGADLSGAYLSGADLSGADLSGANLIRANLSGANLSGAYLIRANLSGADLSGADLREADLREASLYQANLIRADLSGANLSGADLSGADLREASLYQANLIRANLIRADLSGASLGNTVFADVDLSLVNGLEDVQYRGPSHIDYMTFYKSGPLPEVFLKGCGVPDLLRIYLPDLIAAEGKLYSTFISYSHQDKEFAQKLHDALQKAGARVWLDEKRMKIGQPIYGTVKHAIHGQDRLILICSENSLKSNWVDREVNIALERELELKKDDGNSYVIMPISIDNFVFSKECDFEWTPELKRRLIGDFQKWEDPVEFQKSLDLLIRSLQLM